MADSTDPNSGADVPFDPEATLATARFREPPWVAWAEMNRKFGSSLPRAAEGVSLVPFYLVRTDGQQEETTLEWMSLREGASIADVVDDLARKAAAGSISWSDGTLTMSPDEQSGKPSKKMP